MIVVVCAFLIGNASNLKGGTVITNKAIRYAPDEWLSCC